MPWLEVEPNSLQYPFDHGPVVAAFVNTNSSAALGLIKRFNRWEVAFSHPVRGTQPFLTTSEWAGDGANTMSMTQEQAVIQFSVWVRTRMQGD